MSPEAEEKKLEKLVKEKLEVHVHNQDDGRNYEFKAKTNETLQQVIDGLYEKLRRDQQPLDRLKCKKDGEDVFGFAELAFKRYLADGHCPKLRWLWSGDTGGA